MPSQSRTAASTMCSSRSCHKVLYLHANDGQPTLEHTFYHIMLAVNTPAKLQVGLNLSVKRLLALERVQLLTFDSHQLQRAHAGHAPQSNKQCEGR